MKTSSARKIAETRFQLLLRVKHPTLDTAEITRELGIKPEHAANVGAAVSATGKTRLHSESYWVAALPTPSVQETIEGWKSMSPNQPQGLLQLSREARRGLGLTQVTGFLDLQLLSWLRRLGQHASFFKSLNDSQGSVTLVLMRPNRDAPITITPYLGRRLADLGVRLEID